MDGCPRTGIEWQARSADLREALGWLRRPSRRAASNPGRRAAARNIPSRAIRLWLATNSIRRGLEPIARVASCARAHWQAAARVRNRLQLDRASSAALDRATAA